LKWCFLLLFGLTADRVLKSFRPADSGATNVTKKEIVLSTAASRPARPVPADKSVRIRGWIDRQRSRNIKIERFEGVRGKWTVTTGGDESVEQFLKDEKARENGAKVTGSKGHYTIDLELSPAEKPAAR
jgi:hypothetical protein